MESHLPEKAKNDELKLISFCPLCETQLSQAKMQLVGSKGDTKLVHVTCDKCHTLVLFLVFSSMVGQSTVGLVTDLKANEVNEYRIAPAISTDDVIDIHLLLKSGAWKKRFPIDNRGDLAQNAQRSV